MKTKTTDEMDEKIEEKLSQLEDRSRRNNLRINGISETENEKLDESETKIKQLLSKELDISIVNIERAHRNSKIKRDDGTINTKRTIMVKFQSYKDKANILNERDM